MSGVGNSIFTLGVSDCEELVGLLTGDDVTDLEMSVSV